MEQKKMARQNRASQFAPFDALKGFRESLKIKEIEHEKVAKKIMSEEKASFISKTLYEIKKYDKVTCEYYDRDCGQYKNIEGEILPFFLDGYIKIMVNQNIKIKIFLEDVYDIKLK